MTDPRDAELLELATLYALDAISASERADIEQRVRNAPQEIAEAFDEEVRSVREAMAAVSAVTAVEPPLGLRNQLLATVALGRRQRFGWRSAVLVTAAAVFILFGAVAIGWTLRQPAKPPTAAQVLAAPDVRTAFGRLPSGGTATVMFSRQKDAAVLVMNNVAPPAPGTVYQMWLLGAKGPVSAGTMDAKAVGPSTTAVLPDIANSSALAFTIEPGSGSTYPTGQIFAELPLT